MFYSKYRLYDDGMEIMVPSYLKKTDSMLSAQYLWSSEDKRTLVNISRGNADLTEEDLGSRLNEYYRGFSNDIKDFKCKLIKKRFIYQRPYGEIRYYSKMMGYDFFNMFLLGIYGGRELIFTIQCIENDKNFNLRVFENISDSLKVINGGDRHAG